MPKATFHFPPDFKWGVATASHQVEGDNQNNQWWVWENQPGRILNDDKAGLACDWWLNAENDFEIAAQMGLNSLRLSIEWSRIEIEPGQIDTTAIDRYRSFPAAKFEIGEERFSLTQSHTQPSQDDRHYRRTCSATDSNAKDSGPGHGRPKTVVRTSVL